VAVQVAKNPDLAFFLLERRHEIFYCNDFRMEGRLWINPLSIQVNTSQRISIVATDYSVWVEAWNQYKGVESAEVLGFSTVRSYEIIDASEYFTAWGFSGVHSACDQNYLVAFNALRISTDHYLVERHAGHCPC
jgi:hypothetical protein